MDATSPVIITAYRLKFGMTTEMLGRAVGLDTERLEMIERSDQPVPEWLRSRIIRQFGWFDFDAFAATGEPETMLLLAGQAYLPDRKQPEEKERWAAPDQIGETRSEAPALRHGEHGKAEDYTYEMQCAAIRPEAVTALRHLMRMSLGEFSRTLGIPGKVLIEHETGKRIVSAHLVDRIRDKLEINLFDFEKSDFAQDVISGEGPYSSRMQAK